VLSPQVRYEEVNGPSSVAVRGQRLAHNVSYRGADAMSEIAVPGRPEVIGTQSK
jgi:hypothetical protein